ncbi:MAG: YtxH domain-containing protein [Saprospiraceae bacterium]
MKNSSKVLLAMGASAPVGGLAGYYLNSDNGRKARKRAVKNIRKTANEATDKINDMAETAKTAIGQFAGEAKAYMNTITEAAGDTLMAAEEKLEKGKEAAKAKAQSLKNAIMTNSVES